MKENGILCINYRKDVEYRYGQMVQGMMDFGKTVKQKVMGV